MSQNIDTAANIARINSAIATWRVLAGEQEALAELGLAFPPIALGRAETYRRTADALEAELHTGVEHCSCCCKPVER